MPVPTLPQMTPLEESEWIQSLWANWLQLSQRQTPPAGYLTGCDFSEHVFCSLKLTGWFSLHSCHLPLAVTLNFLSSDPVSLSQAFFVPYYLL